MAMMVLTVMVVMVIVVMARVEAIGWKRGRRKWITAGYARSSTLKYVVSECAHARVAACVAECVCACVRARARACAHERACARACMVLAQANFHLA
eukprot:159762-Pleurochrysis_carterae.AAC.1